MDDAGHGARAHGQSRRAKDPNDLVAPKRLRKGRSELSKPLVGERGFVIGQCRAIAECRDGASELPGDGYG